MYGHASGFTLVFVSAKVTTAPPRNVGRILLLLSTTPDTRSTAEFRADTAVLAIGISYAVGASNPRCPGRTVMHRQL